MHVFIKIMIRGYQRLVSPFLVAAGVRCRFYPSCSDYAHRAYTTQPFWRATRLTLKRLGKCQPLHPGGVDILR